MPIRGQELVPFTTATWLDGRLQFHPKAALHLGYDSNLHLADANEEDDGFVLATAGVNAQWLGIEALTLGFDAEFSHQAYFDFSEENRSEGSGQLSLTYEAERWTSDLEASFRREDRFILAEGRRSDLRQWQGVGTFQRRTLTDRFGFGLTLLRTDDDGAARDRSNASLRGWWQRETPAGRELRSEIAVSQRWYDEHAVWQDGEDYRGQFGLGWPLASDLHLSGHLGLAWARFDDDFAGDPAYDDEQVFMPLLALEASFGLEGGLRFLTGVDTDLVAGSQSNATRVYRFHADCELPVGEHGSLRPGLVYARREASGHPTTVEDEPGTTLELSLEAVQMFRRGLAAQAAVRWLNNDGGVGAGFEQFVFELGIAGVY